jgi:sulfite oxidase
VLKALGASAAYLLSGCRTGGRNSQYASESILQGKSLRVLGDVTPLNAEPRLDLLVQSWITPVELFFVRSHAPIPRINPRRLSLSVEGLVNRPRSFTLDQLRSEFDKTTITATVTCAGNRRVEHNRIQKVGGVQWGAGAIGNAVWSGVRLSDLLRACGLNREAGHVWFAGLDRVEKAGRIIPFGGSIPVEKALASDTTGLSPILAYEMNGKPLPPEHGYPLRAVVPGYIGARSVKWLGRILVDRVPSDNHYLTSAYKLVTDDTDDQWANAQPIYEYLLNSVICVPRPGQALTAGKTSVHGYALAPGIGGRSIARVEVSADGGQSWTAADLNPRSSPWCWRLWQADAEVDATTKSLVVRATDSAGLLQPKTLTWNFKGYLNNAWHEVPVRVRK